MLKVYGSMMCPDCVDCCKELTEEAKAVILDGGYEPMYGARPLKRYLQKHVETLAARLILAGNVGTGDVILIDAVEGKLVAECK